MFVVYNPEGSTLASMAQQIPQRQVEPSTRINPVENTLLNALDVSQGESHSQPKSSALNAYKKQQYQERKVVVTVAEIMQSPVHTIEQSFSITQAYYQMRDLGIEHLPVVNEHQQLIGVVTCEHLMRSIIVDDKDDVVTAQDFKVFDVMTPQIVAAAPETEIRYIAQAMVVSNLDAIVITQPDETILGIITQGDLIKRLSQEPPIELYV